MDWSLGEVVLASGDAEERVAEEDENLRGFVERRLSGEVLDGLYEHWLRVHGWRRRQEPSLELCHWEPGVMLRWGEVFPDSRPDRYRLDGPIPVDRARSTSAAAWARSPGGLRDAYLTMPT